MMNVSVFICISMDFNGIEQMYTVTTDLHMMFT
jgi:hypothetical protein